MWKLNTKTVRIPNTLVCLIQINLFERSGSHGLDALYQGTTFGRAVKD
jgi:hypothetical protein